MNPSEKGMFVFSSTLSWVFTAVFTLTGVYSLVRLGELASGSDRTGSRVAELSHLLMSIAMIAMAWAWVGGPSSVSGLVLIVVFGVFVVWFLGRLVWPAAGHPRVTEGYHLVTNAAMVWMVAAMPEIMAADMAAVGGHDQSSDGMAGMPGMGGMPGTGVGGSMPSSTPVWATVVSWVFIVLLVAAAVFWATRIAGPSAANGCGPATAATVESLPVSVTDDPSSEESTAPGGTDGAVALAAPATRTRSTGPRLDAGCHLLMSLGMAGMLLAML